MCFILQQPSEEVTYASIDHSSTTPRATTDNDNDCDYATVTVPRAFLREVESDCSSKEDCGNDYVLMG